MLFKTSETNQDNEAFFGGLKAQLDIANEDAGLIKKELNLLTAEGQWLDDWGSDFGLQRRIGETDEKFLDRILSLMEDKVTIPAIKVAIKKVLGDDTIVSIYEPYVDLAFFNISAFSGTGRYPDKDYYRTHVIDITINKPPTEALVRFINKIKPSGVSVKFTYKPTPALESVIIDTSSDSVVYNSTTTETYKSVLIDGEDKPDARYSEDASFSGDTVIWSESSTETV